MYLKELAKKFNKEYISSLSLSEFKNIYSIDEKGNKTTRFGDLDALYYEITGKSKPVSKKESKGD
jgi:hypothetical protein